MTADPILHAAIVRVLREHVETVSRAKKGATWHYDAVCAACNEPLPWGEDQRTRAVRAHQADVICGLVLSGVDQ